VRGLATARSGEFMGLPVLQGAGLHAGEPVRGFICDSVKIIRLPALAHERSLCL